MGLALHVQVLQGGAPVGQHQFDSDSVRTVKIGRLSSAQIKLSDPSVARIHAVIEFAGGSASVVDMGSTIGTTVNGAKIHKQPLNHGDQVQVGDTTLIVGVGQPFVAQQAAPQPAQMAPGQMAGQMPGQMMPGQMPAMQQPMPGQMPQMVPGQMPGQVPAQGMPAMQQPQPGFAPGQVPGMAPAAAPGMVPGQQMPQQAAMAPGMVPGMGPQTPAQRLQVQGAQPAFDGGIAGPEATQQRIKTNHLVSPAVESKPHPALPPEPKMTEDNRVLEMRIYWGQVLLAVEHYLKPNKITIGEAKGTDFFISSEGLPNEIFPLVRFVDGEYVLTFCDEMEGELEIGGQIHQLSSLRTSSLSRKDDDMQSSYQIRMPMTARGLVHWGGATFALRFVAPAEPVKSPFMKNIDLQFVNMFLVSALLHIATVTTMLVWPYDTDALRMDIFDKDAGRFADIILQGPQEDEDTKKKLEEIEKKMQEKKKEMKEPEDKKNVLEKIKKPVPQTQKQRQNEVSKKFSKLFSGSGGGGALLGGGGGGTLSGTLSNVIGTAGKGSASASMAGLGIRGSGPSTGGGLGTSRGIAGIGTKGRLGGGGLGYGAGGGLGTRSDRGMINIGTPVVMGALPKEVIQRVINQNKAQVRFCYEKQLQRDQNLEGRIMMRWVIGATGSVDKVKVAQSSMNSKAVESCIAAKIRGWKFPAPSGGGIVEVNYPFVFRAG